MEALPADLSDLHSWAVASNLLANDGKLKAISICGHQVKGKK